jgi:aryl-alcohol dehydrogenase-like predicted oxidoreductase
MNFKRSCFSEPIAFRIACQLHIMGDRSKNKLQGKQKKKEKWSMTPTNQRRVLGASGLEVSSLGLGTNRWSVRSGKDDGSIFQTFQAALDAGFTFFDTAEIYNGGESERLLGEYLGWDKRPVVLATKFAPLPNRLSPHTLMDALDASLSRLNVETIDLYYIHWPYALMRLDALMDMMALAVRIGKIRAVGVSNFSAKQMRQAAARLARYNIPLASNEVHYSLLHRRPEVDGVLEACRELNVALIAYRPLESGQLNLPARASDPTPAVSPRARAGLLPALRKMSQQARQEQKTALQVTLSEIASAHEKTIGQVALNWLLQRDEHIIPIPGSTNPGHVIENRGALDWQLNTDECALLDKVSLPWKK